MKRFNHGLIVGFAVLLLAAVFFTGCSSPTNGENGKDGRDGLDFTGEVTSAQQSQELAKYGYTFGDPIHTVVGRPEVLGPIVGKTPVGAVSGMEVTPVTIAYLDKSVTFKPAASYADIDAVITALTGFINAGGVEVAASKVTVGGGAHLRIAATGTQTGDIVVYAAANAASALVKLLGAGSAATEVTSPTVVAGAKDTWVYPIISSDVGGSEASSEHSKLTVGAVSLPVAAGTAVGDIVTAIADEIGYRAAMVGPVEAYANFAVTATSPTFGAGLQFEAINDGPGTFDRVAMRPTITDNTDTDLTTYGYTLLTKHMAVGVQASGSPAVDGTPGKVTSGNSIENNSGAIVANDKITIAYNNKTDVIVFPTVGVDDVKTTSDSGAALLAITGTTGRVTGVTIAVVSHKLVFTAPATVAALPLVVTATGGIATGTNAIFGGSLATVTSTAGTASTAVAPVEDTWRIQVIGGGQSGDPSPTVASKITILPATTAGTVYVPESTASADDIANLVDDASTAISAAYAAASVTNNVIDFVQSSPGVGSIATVTATIAGL